MRILHFADGYLPRVGGIETVVRNLCREQRARGHDVAVATGGLPGCGGEDVIDGVPVFRRRAPDLDMVQDPGLLMRLVEDAIATKRRWRPDIVHVHGSGLSGWINLLSGKPDGRDHATIVTLHGSMHLLRRVQQRVITEADGVTAVSASLRDEFAELAGQRGEPIQVLYNGLEAPDLSPNGLAFHPVTVLCCGRLVEDKGFDIALRASAGIPGLRLVFAGDGAARPDLERLAATLGLSDRVDFRGLVDPAAVPSLINEATMVVVPSRCSEAFGLVVVEAALMQRPTVASRKGGLPEVVDHGETGLLVPAEDPAALAAAIAELVADPARAVRMGIVARERALARFSIARCAAEFDELYQNAVRRRSSFAGTPATTPGCVSQ